MAVLRDRITVFPPDGETVVVDIKKSGVSLGTAHAERTTARTLTLPLTISARTSFYVTPGDGPFTVSVKLDGVEIASANEAPVTVSTFPAEVRTRIDAAELGSVAGGGSGGSPWSEHDLSDLLASEGADSGTGVWADAAGPIIEQTLDVGDGALGWQAGIGSPEYVVQVDVKVLTGQDAGTTVKAGFQAGELCDSTPSDVGLGVGILANETGDTTDFALGAIVDGSAGLLSGGASVTIEPDTWYTLRGVVSATGQSVYLDGVYAATLQILSGGNGSPGLDSVSLVATGLVQFRNLKVWTQALPA